MAVLCGCPQGKQYFAAVTAPNGSPYHYHDDGTLATGGPDGIGRDQDAKKVAIAKAKPIAGWQPRGWTW